MRQWVDESDGGGFINDVGDPHEHAVSFDPEHNILAVYRAHDGIAKARVPVAGLAHARRVGQSWIYLCTY